MSKSNRLTKTARDQTIIDALGTQLKGASTITLDATVYKVKDLQQQFQAEVDAIKATLSARTAWTQATLAEKKAGSQVTLVRKALRSYLIATYGAKSDVVAEFGFTPKETTMDVATKAGAIEKRAATIAAGGTKAKSTKGTANVAASPAAPASAAAPVQGIPAVNGLAPKTAATS